MNPDTKALAAAKARLDQARDAFTNLTTNQQQLDADGCMVGVSRQAVDETVDAILEASDILLTALTQPPPVSEIRERVARIACAWMCKGMYDEAEAIERGWRRWLPVADSILALLPQPPGSDGEWRTPEGWKLVPVEPTEAMISAFIVKHMETVPQSTKQMTRRVQAARFKIAYSTVLAASPTPPSPSTVAPPPPSPEAQGEKL